MDGFPTAPRVVRCSLMTEEPFGDLISAAENQDERNSRMGNTLMPRPVPCLQGDLVTLRVPDPVADAADFYEMNLDPEMHTWTGNQVLASVSEARRELENYLTMDYITTWMIVDNPSRKVVGRFFISMEEKEGRLIAGEGNRIARSFWRKGHNKEARKLVAEYIFAILRADMIETKAWSDNTNSIRSIEAFGFLFYRSGKEFFSKLNKELEVCYYRLTREKWTAKIKRTTS